MPYTLLDEWLQKNHRLTSRREIRQIDRILDEHSAKSNVWWQRCSHSSKESDIVGPWRKGYNMLLPERVCLFDGVDSVGLHTSVNQEDVQITWGGLWWLVSIFWGTWIIVEHEGQLLEVLHFDIWADEQSLVTFLPNSWAQNHITENTCNRQY